METVEYKNISFTVWDVGGQVSVERHVLRNVLKVHSRTKFVHYGDITFKILKVKTIDDEIQYLMIIIIKTFCFLGLIFVVDSNDRERVGEARDELQRMLAEDELREAVLLIFANKQVRHFSSLFSPL